MNVLLINNPQKAFYFNNFNIPNLGLLSIASNLDKRHKVKIIDDFYDPAIISRFFSGMNFENFNLKIYDVINEFKPDIIGLTAMTFQYSTARKMAKAIKDNFSKIMIVLGGYHATIMYDEIYDSDDKNYFDFIIRNEGEITFNDLVKRIEFNGDFSDIKGLSYCINNKVYHNSDPGIIDLNKNSLPDRKLINKNLYYCYNFFTGKYESLAVLETSRGCSYSCKFCSITKMYGHSFRKYDLDRVIEDIYNIKENGDIQRIVIIDDNITLDLERFENLCDLIIKNRLNSVKYFIQASSIGLSGSEELIRKMKLAGFDWVFIGIENLDKSNLEVLGKGDIINKSKTALKYLNKYGIASWGGGIVGMPDDTREKIKELYETYSKLKVTLPAIQILNPYPKTKIREEYLHKNLITNIENYDMYEGFWANIRTNYLTSDALLYFNLFEQIKYDVLKKGLSHYHLKNHPLIFIKSLLTNHLKYLKIKSSMLNEKNKHQLIKYIEFTKQTFFDRINRDFLFNWILYKDIKSELSYEYSDGIRNKAIRIKYNRSKNGWWYMTNYIYLDSLDQEGIELYIKGTANVIRLQITDKDDIKWVYEIIPDSKWKKINIPFSDFILRKDNRTLKRNVNSKFKIPNFLAFNIINSYNEEKDNGEFSIDEIRTYR
jgi:anaerobic magnesium-protoporphyrin IX monomethyl ester cyclase